MDTNQKYADRIFKQIIAFGVPVVLFIIFNTMRDGIWSGQMMESIAAGDEYTWYRYLIAIGMSLFSAAVLVEIILYLIWQCHALKNGVLFEKRCGTLLIILSITYFFYLNFSQNAMYMAVNDRPHYVLDTEAIVLPIMLFFFSQLYRLAAHVAEENSMTI